MASKKTESVEEYMARGGVITLIPTVVSEIKSVVPKKNLIGCASMMSMEEAELFYSETRLKPKVKKNKAPKIDISALPPGIKSKFIDKLIDGETDEDEDEEKE